MENIVINQALKNKLKQIKMVVFDIDGTLIAHQKVWDGKINELHLEALRQLKLNSYLVVLASARTMVTIDHLHQNPYVDYFIGGNGSFIYDCKLAKIIDENVINGDDVNHLLKQIDHRQAKSMTLYGREIIYTNGLETDVNHYILAPFKNQISALFNYQDQKTDLIVIETNDQEINEKLTNEINQFLKDVKSNLTIGAIQSKVIMLTNQGVNKLSAIKRLAKLCNYDLTNVMAFGDSTNDIEMLQGCAIGIVMKNASKKMYQYGDLVTITSAKNGGIYHTLVKLAVFNKKQQKTFIRHGHKNGTFREI